ncbi:MAG: type I phosphomannose isomerase catalytic subunit [Isosphaeraceae bacterium]
MADIPLYPLRFRPILRQLIWGGRRLGTVLHKPIGPADDYAESWELSDYRDAVSVVCEGPLEGTSLRELVKHRGLELLGTRHAGAGQFPLLVKFIDACLNLSVQVHPDDEKGKRLAGDNGKSETWVIVDAEPGSQIYSGLKPGVTPRQFGEAITAGTVEPLLHRFSPRPGDCIMIEAGTVHAIGAGVLLAEIQQMSDATFRIYDWGRVGADGKPRELHVAQALESTDFALGPVNPLVPAPQRDASGNVREKLSRSAYFALERWLLARPAVLGGDDRFTILMGLEGRAEVRHNNQETILDFGQTLLLPAALGRCEVVPRDKAVVLTCVTP